ncbi:MAG: U32 family peptidase [Bacteroidales bacterium]|nr:U32 family peptidase [Bacteroidales bacterium]
MKELELLAPARNRDIGIAAVDCGADAVYIGGPDFGARKAAGNAVGDIARLCDYAHRYGVRIFVTVNNLVFPEERDALHRLMLEVQQAGADAFIVRDAAIPDWEDITVPLHASTQCAIRTPERAQAYAARGFSRLVLERQLSLAEIRRIRAAVDCELEVFVHGALCTGYSGECYLSEYIGGRSANRGDCMQACRSRYDLVDAAGNVLVRDKALLSLKDLNLIDRLGELAEAGIVSFKIEGRLKNASYVKNTVRAYSEALDRLVAARPAEYRRASFGRVEGGFVPAPDKTFNRGYTSLYLDGERGRWSSMDAPKSMGEYIGTVREVRPRDARTVEITVAPAAPDLVLRNGDGFSAIAGNAIVGFRGDVCRGNVILAKPVSGLKKGCKLYRNADSAFEKELEGAAGRRVIPVAVRLSVRGDGVLAAEARSGDGRTVSAVLAGAEPARDRARMASLLESQLSKHYLHYAFRLDAPVPEGPLPLLGAAQINGLRRELGDRLESMPCKTLPMAGRMNGQNERIDEDGHREGELMRSKYCIRYELGLCPSRQGAAPTGPLFLVNNGRRFPLGFDCGACEMTVGIPAEGPR